MKKRAFVTGDSPMANDDKEERMRKLHKFLDKHDIKSLGKVGRFRIGVCNQCSMPFVKYGITDDWFPITKVDGNLISAAIKLAGKKHVDAIFKYAKSEDYNTDDLSFLTKKRVIRTVVNLLEGTQHG